MHSKIFALTKVFLKNSFQGRMGNNANGKTKKGKGMFAIMLISFLYLGAFLGFMSYSILESLVQMQQEQAFLGMLFLAMAFFLLFQSIFSSMNVLYFSKDIEHILPLPAKPWQIVIAKLNVMLVTEYIMEIIFFAVPLTIYGVLTGAGFLFYIIALAVLLIFPILPLLIASFIVMVMMSFAKFTRNRDRFQIIASALAIIVAFGISFMNSSSEELSEEQMLEMLLRANSVVERMESYFITLKPTIQALTANSVGNAMLALGKMVLITGIVYSLFVLVAQKLYLRGAVGNIASGKKAKKLKENKAYHVQTVGRSYIKKELRTLIRNPIFFMQCVLPAILMPVLFGVIFLSGMSNVPDTEMVGIEYNTMILCITLGMIQFFSMMIYVAITAISREGSNALWMKYTPIALHKQFVYKAIPNTVISMVMILMVIITVSVITQIPIVLFVPILIIAIMWNIVQSFLMELIDLKKPKLEWETEYAVVKQNLNLIWPMLLGLVNIGILIIVGITLENVLLYWVEGIMIILLAIVVRLIYQYVKKNEEKIFQKIF